MRSEQQSKGSQGEVHFVPGLLWQTDPSNLTSSSAGPLTDATDHNHPDTSTCFPGQREKGCSEPGSRPALQLQHDTFTTAAACPCMNHSGGTCSTDHSKHHRGSSCLPHNSDIMHAQLPPEPLMHGHEQYGVAAIVIPQPIIEPSPAAKESKTLAADIHWQQSNATSHQQHSPSTHQESSPEAHQQQSSGTHQQHSPSLHQQHNHSTTQQSSPGAHQQQSPILQHHSSKTHQQDSPSFQCNPIPYPDDPSLPSRSHFTHSHCDLAPQSGIPTTSTPQATSNVPDKVSSTLHSSKDPAAAAAAAAAAAGTAAAGAAAPAPEALSAADMVAGQLAAAEQAQRLLNGHKDSVTCCAISGRGKYIVSGSRDTTIRVFHAVQQEVVHVLAGHEGPVTCCAVLPDSTHVISGSMDATCRVWDLQTGKLQHVLAAHTAEVTCLATAPNSRYVVSGSQDTSLKVWDATSGCLAHSLEGHHGRVTCCCVSFDSRLVVSGSRDTTARVWDMKTGKHLQSLTAHEHAVLCCAVTPNGRLVITGGQDCMLYVYDLETGHKRYSLLGHTSAISCCEVVPKSMDLVSGSYDCTLRLWDLRTGKLRHSLERHTERVTCCAVSRCSDACSDKMADGKRFPVLASGSADKSVIMWRLDSGRMLQQLQHHDGEVMCVGITPDGRHVVSGS